MSVYIVGLTGQTGAGKSTVSQFFSKFGLSVIDCDQVAREVTARGSDCLIQIVREFGDVLTSKQDLNRRVLGAIVFQNPAKLARLDEILFPAIRSRMAEKTSSLEKAGAAIVVWDAPTLFESGADQECDCIVSVVASKTIRLNRIMERDGLSPKMAENRMKSQKSEAFFIEHSNIVIRNNDGLSDLLEQSKKAVEKIREEANGH